MSQAGSHDGNNTDADHADLASQLGTLHQNVMDIGSMLGTNDDPQGVGVAYADHFPLFSELARTRVAS